ncbi:MAG: glycosyl hydrolase [Planctomycetes bacterium]|nr:glycosyl hydrolase [Planctomycetota bacterium]MDP6128727.1 sialidase family protein [Planctomycetota bacterium]
MISFILFLSLSACPQAGYSIPVLDLDQDSKRQSLVDREEGQYLGHVTTVLLKDGKTILATYPKGHGRGQIVLKRSEDGGLSWSDRLPVPKSWSTSKEVPTIFRTFSPTGEERLILQSGLFPIRQSISADNGKTWTELEAIGDYGGIVALSCMMQCKDGSYLAMFHDDGRFIGNTFRPDGDSPFHLYQIRSLDGGLTWSSPEIIANHPKAHLCEPGIFRSPDGNQLLVLLRENSRKFNSFFMTSDDEGKTWSKPKETTGALTGDRHTGVYSRDGRLFISFRDTTRESSTQGDWVAWVGTYKDIVEGREGQYRVRLKDNHHRWDCAYPGVLILEDDTIVATTYGHWKKDKPPYILSVRVKLEELDFLAQKKGEQMEMRENY